MAWGWDWMGFQIPSNPKHTLILRFYEGTTLGACQQDPRLGRIKPRLLIFPQNGNPLGAEGLVGPPDVGPPQIPGGFAVTDEGHLDAHAFPSDLRMVGIPQ